VYSGGEAVSPVTYRRWTPFKLFKAFVGAALLFIGVVATISGTGFLFDHSATVPFHGTRTNDPWVKAVYPAIGLGLVVIGSLLWLGYPHLRPRQDKAQPPPSPAP
jgi:hypothetical protein